ncbi:sigma 54-interacting transcriptional regulator [Bacillus sp. AFS088145]|uniref:sigma-54 interaction domain-containing protein n=1 Tax=Bacillus sp. AFS088145 TaxID=2033514 RepID=UPI000BF47C5A|nr:sigma 54-interacting transcriptional regulator [Bacillus sp. AFS088145]PFH87927.1 sigma-54-dependent Fis family transcriptional regulator [Bacillus sp. AFS088145]
MNSMLESLPFEWISEIINLATEWIVVVNREGKVLYMNESYCEFVGRSADEVIGMPVEDVIENSRMHIVAKTGQAEVAEIHPIKNTEMVANRYPLYIGEELVGAVGTVMFRNAQDWIEYSKKVEPLVEELNYYKRKFEKELNSKYKFNQIIGDTPVFNAAKNLAEQVSASSSAILLFGESGTGKELFAHAIHDASPRRNFPFVRVNCASIPEHLLESELFGYEEGAFTGAKRGGKKGKFEIANRGTIFLDEIGDMSLHMQSKLLRVLQEREIERVGGSSPISIDVRVIAATHRNLEKMVVLKEFRQDLYYRLNVIKIDIPPLRSRINDLPLIADSLIKKLERKFHRNGIQISNEVFQILKSHHWPGNIRELENVLERCINVLNGKVITPKQLPLYLYENPTNQKNTVEFEKNASQLSNQNSLKSLKEMIEETEQEAIKRALIETQGNKIEAAKLLEISKSTFYEKCKAYNIKN